MKQTIARHIRNRVAYTFTTSSGEVFYLMVHDCGDLLLCSTSQYKACKLDAGSLGVPEDHHGLWILKHDWEPKLDISGLCEKDISLLLAETGMPAPRSERLGVLTDRKTQWYGQERNWQSPMMRSVLTWADKHPRLAKSGYFEGLIARVRQVVDTPLPDEQYTGF